MENNYLKNMKKQTRYPSKKMICPVCGNEFTPWYPICDRCIELIKKGIKLEKYNSKLKETSEYIDVRIPDNWCGPSYGRAISGKRSGKLDFVINQLVKELSLPSDGSDYEKSLFFEGLTINRDEHSKRKFQKYKYDHSCKKIVKMRKEHFRLFNSLHWLLEYLFTNDYIDAMRRGRKMFMELKRDYFDAISDNWKNIY